MPTGAVPAQSAMFQGEGFKALSTPWIGFFNDLLKASGADARGSAGAAAYSLSVKGTLAIGSDLAPKTYVLKSVTPSVLRVDVKQAPVGANLVVVLSYYTAPGAATEVATFTVAPGKLSDTQTTKVGVPAGAWWEVDITGVGTTFPGSDLTVTVQ
jgi:hypothetical protein